MPVVQPSFVPARALHSRESTFFRKDATEILLPEDLSEQAGQLTTLNKEGFPLGADGTPYFEIATVENPDGWAPYIGTASQGVNGPTKQVASALPIARNSFMANQPPIQGDLPPGLLAAAKIPRPLAPLLVAEPAGVEGYAAGPETSPYYVAFTWVRGGRHSKLSPFTRVPAVEFGQSIRAILPSEIPEGVDGIGIWLTEPGTSTPSLPGPAKLQRVRDVSRYNPGTYDLTGPYRHEKREPARNETLLPSPTHAPKLVFRRSGRASKPGTYYAAAQWTDANGESLASPISVGVTIMASSRFTDDEGNPIAGAGYLLILRGNNPPPGATGWRPLVYREGNWYAVYDSYQGLGNEKPYPLDTMIVQFAGWSSATDSEWSSNERVFLVQRDLPTENTSGIEAPTDALEQPVVFGVNRLPAGEKFVQITESLRGVESLPSPTASITINSNEVLRVIRRDRVNIIPNGDHIEVGAAGTHLDQINVTTNGVVFANGTDTVMRTNGSQTGSTPSSATRPVDIEHDERYRIDTSITVEDPLTGAFQGSTEVVFEQINSSGAVTQTVIGTISQKGTLTLKKLVHTSSETGLPAGSIQLLASTIQADILVRYAGTNKNLTIRIHHRFLEPGTFARRISVNLAENFPYPYDPSGLDASLPVGSAALISLPPKEAAPSEPAPGVSPALVEWVAPDRPSSSGVLLEAKHDFETSIPVRWKQHASDATLTRYATSPLAGTNSLRSYKAS